MGQAGDLFRVVGIGIAVGADADVLRSGTPKEGPGGSLERQQRESSPAIPVSMSLPHRLKAGSSRTPNLPLHQRQATGPLTRGRAAASGKGETSRRSAPRLKRTLEQAQPSMANRLKVGAASKDSG